MARKSLAVFIQVNSLLSILYFFLEIMIYKKHQKYFINIKTFFILFNTVLRIFHSDVRLFRFKSIIQRRDSDLNSCVFNDLHYLWQTIIYSLLICSILDGTFYSKDILFTYLSYTYSQNGVQLANFDLCLVTLIVLYFYYQLYDHCRYVRKLYKKKHISNNIFFLQPVYNVQILKLSSSKNKVEVANHRSELARITLLSFKP